MNSGPIFLPPQPRILITRTDRIGDLVLSTPVFEAVRKKYPDAWIACMTFTENREIVEGNPFLDEVILYDKKGTHHGYFGNLLLAGTLRKKKFDVVIHLHATNRMHWVGWLAGIPVRIGWDRKADRCLTLPFPDIKAEGRKHEAEYNFELLAPLGVACPEKMRTYFPVFVRSRSSLEKLLAFHKIPANRPWVIISPSASCPSKRWPAQRFAELADRVTQELGAAVILIGARSDRDIASKVKRFSDMGLYDLTGRLTLGCLAELFSRSKLLISNDSGPVHIATAVGTPVISIFGRKQPGLSPQRWKPLGKESVSVWKDVGCTECLAHKCQIQFLCLDAVTVPEVFEHARRFAGRWSGEAVKKKKGKARASLAKEKL